MDFEREIDHLLSERDIRDTIYSYCRGVDRLDLDLVRACYHDDAIDDHGAFRGPPDAYVEWLADRLPRYLHSSHTIGNILIRLDGVSAWVESYCTVHQRLHGENGMLLDRVGDLRYVDRFERRETRWRIADRRVVWGSNRVDTGTSTHLPEGAISGRRDRDDPSYHSP